MSVAYDGACSIHGDLIYIADDPHGVTCPREDCERIIAWIPSFARVPGTGWFRPGWDVGLGEHVESMDHRKRLMKEKHCEDSAGGGDINTQPEVRSDAFGCGDRPRRRR